MTNRHGPRRKLSHGTEVTARRATISPRTSIATGFLRDGYSGGSGGDRAGAASRGAPRLRDPGGAPAGGVGRRARTRRPARRHVGDRAAAAPAPVSRARRAGGRELRRGRRDLDPRPAARGGRPAAGRRGRGRHRADDDVQPGPRPRPGQLAPRHPPDRHRAPARLHRRYRRKRAGLHPVEHPAVRRRRAVGHARHARAREHRPGEPPAAGGRPPAAAGRRADPSCVPATASSISRRSCTGAATTAPGCAAPRTAASRRSRCGRTIRSSAHLQPPAQEIFRRWQARERRQEGPHGGGVARGAGRRRFRLRPGPVRSCGPAWRRRASYCRPCS